MLHIISLSHKCNLNQNEEPPPITRVAKHKKIKNSVGKVVEQLKLFFLFFKYILLIMLLQFSHFLSFSLLHPAPTSSIPPLYLWVVHISSLASLFPILFLTSPYFMPTSYASYSLYLPPNSLPPTPHWKPSMWCPFLWFCSCSGCLLSFCFCFLGAVVDSYEFVVILLCIFFYLLFLR